MATAVRPVRECRSGRLVGVEAMMTSSAAGLGFAAASALLPRLPDGVWVAIRLTPDVVTNLELSPLYAIARTDRRRVVIEISARESVADKSLLKAAAEVFREHGVLFALGDVGADYSSLARVLQAQPDFVTSTPSLARGMAGDRVKRELTHAVVRVVRDVGAQLTADGVDSADDLDAVAALDVDQVMGHAVGHATTNPAVFERWPLDRSRPGYGSPGKRNARTVSMVSASSGRLSSR